MNQENLSQETAQRLMAHARQAAAHAYAPYSHFQVGAALLLETGEIVGGANVENASYGLTLCAERVALVKAVTEGKRSFLAIAVWGEQCPNGAITPCGACRQMLVELMPLDAPVLTTHPETGEIIRYSVAQLLPSGFVLPRTGSNEPHGSENRLLP